MAHGVAAFKKTCALFAVIYKCVTLQRTATLCNTLQHTVACCKHPAIHCTCVAGSKKICTSYTATQRCVTLPHIASFCNTLQRAATHCNALQHTATRCNTLRVRFGFHEDMHFILQQMHVTVRLKGYDVNTLHHIASHCIST